ncbi:four-carbon acid sugar kinase family protein [Intrasporangium sp. DVR]|uniref:four-carbon acid sugar kinase family protein n=1 Tax=Intrasporangium sp. DVR TaxID=3127867 RepID=UPI00313A5DD0
MRGLELAVIADDLSGAAESASTAPLRIPRNVVLLSSHTEVNGPVKSVRDARILTIDTNSRGLPPDEAGSMVRAAARQVESARIVVKKVDSLLRGNVAAEVGALQDELGRTPVVAVSLPRMRRAVRAGVLYVDGTPLHETGLWQIEGRMPPGSVAEALSPLQTLDVRQEVVASGVAAIAQALRQAESLGCIAVCDAADDDDLATITRAARSVWARPLLVGSSALVAAAVRSLGPDQASTAPRPILGVSSLLVALGTRARGIGSQLDRLASSAAYVDVVSPSELLTDPGAIEERLARVEATGLVVVTLDPSASVEPARSAQLAQGFAEVVSPLAARFAGVFLSGGETARAVLDLLGVQALTVMAELEPGTVVSTTTTGQVVVTRPGSFGDADSLNRTARQLLTEAATTKENS